MYLGKLPDFYTLEYSSGINLVNRHKKKHTHNDKTNKFFISRRIKKQTHSEKN